MDSMAVLETSPGDYPHQKEVSVWTTWSPFYAINLSPTLKDPQTAWIVDQLVLFLKHTSVSAAVDDLHVLPFITGHDWLDPSLIRTRMPDPFLY